MANPIVDEENRKRLLELLEKAVQKNAPKEEFGLLFSGGIDSALLALLFKKLGLSFKCYFGYVGGLGQPKDLDYANKVAKMLGLDLETVSMPFEHVPKLISALVPLIGTTNPVQVGIALPIALACKRAKQDHLKVIFSGMGADELFAGYAKFRGSENIAKQSLELLEMLPEHDLKRDLAITQENGLKLKIPFLDSEVVKFALSLKKEFKLSPLQNKVILRALALELGLSEEISERKKLAAQYGSNFDKALEKLARKANAKTKSDYLAGFKKGQAQATVLTDVGKSLSRPSSEKPAVAKPAQGQKVPIAALSSGGKDSCLALWLMQKKGFEVRCLVSIIPDNPDSFMYHQPNLEILMMQSRALGIPLVFERTRGEKEKELDALEQALSEAKKGYGIRGVVSGALFSTYQKERLQKICDSLNLKLFSPLWYKEQVEELHLLVDNGFVFIISKVAGKGFGEQWLCKPIGKKEVSELASLAKEIGSNAAGEGGEFESIVLDAPNFGKKINILSAKKNMQNEFTGTLDIEEAVLEGKN